MAAFLFIYMFFSGCCCRSQNVLKIKNLMQIFNYSHMVNAAYKTMY